MRPILKAESPESTAKKSDIYYSVPNLGSEQRRVDTFGAPQRIATGAKPSYGSRIGWWLGFLLVSSTIFLLAAIAFLSWLYFCSRDNIKFRSLAIDALVARAVTLSSVAIRFAVTSMATATTAMIAAIIVEDGYGVRLEHVAQASIARFTGSIVSMTFAGYAFQGVFRVVVPIQLLIAISSQFSSTFLFFDLGTGPVLGFPTLATTNYSYFFNESDGGNAVQPFRDGGVDLFYGLNPSSFETFAEYSEPEKKMVGDEVDDTGPAWRAILPLAGQEDRTTVLEYQGLARLFDARVICARPAFSNLTYTTTVGDLNFRGAEMYTIEGSADVSAQIPDLFASSGDKIETRFRCSLINRLEDGKAVWQQCYTFSNRSSSELLEAAALDTFARIPTLDPIFYRSKDPLVDDFETVPQRVGRTFLLVDAGVPEVFLFPIGTTKGEIVSGNLSLRSSNGTGPWTDIVANFNNGSSDANPSNTSFDIKIRATMCFDVQLPFLPVVRTFNVSASSPVKRSEPIFSWDSSRGQYATLDVRRQLGATNESLTHVERGILSISPQSIKDALDSVKGVTSNETSVISNDSNDVMEVTLMTGGVYGRSIFCERETMDGIRCQSNQPFADLRFPDTRITTSSQFFTHLLQDIIAETDSPALAIQSLVTTRAKMEYFRWINTYTKQAEISMTRVETALIPTRATGFGLVIGLILVQWALLVVVGTMFARKAQYSLLNNAWQVVAQISESDSPAAWAVLSKATMEKDGNIVRHLNEHRRRGGDEVGVGHRRLGMGIDTKFVVENGAFNPVLDPTGRETLNGDGRLRGIRRRPYWQVPDIGSL